MRCRHYSKNKCLLATRLECLTPDENQCSEGYGKGMIKFLKHLGTYDKCCKNPKYLDPFQLLENGVLKKGYRVKLNIAGFEDFTEIDDAFIMKARPGEIESDWVVVLIGKTIYDTTWITEIENY